MPTMPGRSALASGAPIVFLAASLCLIGVLAWQAMVAARGHRALADRVLHDYADLAATELIRRGSTFLFTYGFDVAVQALTRADSTAGGALPSREAIAAALPAQSRRAIELVGQVIRVNAAGKGVEGSGEGVPAIVQSSLARTLSAPQPTSAPSRVITFTHEGRTHVFAFANPGANAETATDVLGFEVTREAMTTWLRQLVLAEPLLPPALASREIATSSLSVDVRAPDGRSLLQSDGHMAPGPFTVSRRWVDEASRRELVGFSVVSRIDEAAASSLIIGGLPQSGIGLLLVLFVLASALTVIAALQLRRDRALTIMQHDFVTRASHELRTPVARIRLFADTLLLDRVRSDEERHAAVHAIDRAARRLSLLVENVLQFSRMDARAGHHAEPTELVAFVRDVAQEFETTIDGAHVVVSSAPPGAHAPIDREGVRQAILNLLDNAWKYGGANGPIAVSVTPATGEIRIRIADSGPGVPERDRARIWEPYVRLDRDRRSSVAGTGIGLAVVREIAGRHGGSAWVETADAGGAAFVLALPVAEARRS